MKPSLLKCLLMGAIGALLLVGESCGPGPKGKVPVRGRVIDKIGKQPLEGVTVTIPGSAPASTDKDGHFTINNVLVSDGKLISAVKDGYNDYSITIPVAGDPTLNVVPMEMSPKGQIYLSPVQPLRIDANDKTRTLRIHNIGNQKAIRVTVKPDPTAQWLSVNPKTPIIVDEGSVGDLLITVDSKGITTIKDYSTKILFEYASTTTNYKDLAEYEVVMAVTSLPVVRRPEILSVVPLAGGYDTEVTITGRNFDTDTSKVKVLFEGGKKSLITSASPTELKVKVPVGAKTGNLQVEVAEQGDSKSNAVFTYNLTCTLSTVAELTTDFYINDITAADGTIYLSGVQMRSGTNKTEIVRSGIYRIGPGATGEAPLLEREAGFADGSVGSTARLVNPTKLAAVNNELYVTDQFDASLYQTNYAESYARIRRIANGAVNTVYFTPLTDRGFINDIVSLPGFNGLAFTDGSYRRYNIGDGSVSPPAAYQGLNLFLDGEGANVYALDAEPENNSTQWVLRKRSAATLLGNGSVGPPRNLGIPNRSDSPDNTNYPKGMVVDPNNRCAYVFDRKVVGSGFAYIVYRVGLDDEKVEVIYNASRVVSQYEDKLLLPDASKGTFASISCLTYDNYRKAVLLVDVNRGNKVRAMECK